MLIDPVTGLFTFVNDDSEDENLPVLTKVDVRCTVKNLVEFILLDEKRVIQNQKLRLFQLAIENDVYVDIDFQKHESDMTTALSDILVDKKAVICYNGGLWPIMTVQARSAALKELSRKSKEATMQKELFKSVVKEENIVHANEMTQQMAKNWSDVQKEIGPYGGARQNR